MTRTAPLLTGIVILLAGCTADAPLEVDSHHAHGNGVTLSSLSQASQARTLDALRRLSAPYHDLAAAQALGYGLLTAAPLTAADGCVSSAAEGGMGYHYTRGDNLDDGVVSLLDPEFLVYAPKQGPRSDGEARTRLAGFDYFLPYGGAWPGPDDPGFVRAPTLHDFPTMRDLPDVAFAPSRFGGWMFHIWLWEHNPDGMFANWNPAVPLCDGSAY